MSADDSDWETAELDVPHPKSRKPASVWAAPPASHPAAGPSQPRLLSRESRDTRDRPAGGEEDEWFRGPQGNRQIWDSANRASNSPLNSQAPGPQLLILKRPNAPKSDQPRSGSATPKTLTQREEEYRLARERIFGAEDESRSEGKDSKDGKVEAEGKKEQRGSREGRDRNQKGTRRSGTSTPTSNSNPRSGRSSPRMRADDLAREVDRLALGHGGQGQYSQPPQQYTQPPQQYSQQPSHQYSQQPPQHYSQPPQQYSQYPQYGLPQPSPYHQPQPRPPQRYQQIYQPDYGSGPQQAPSPRGSPAGLVPVLRGGNSPGIIRQPRGPQGSGFSNGR